jgi:hypothetical protein
MRVFLFLGLISGLACISLSAFAASPQPVGLMAQRVEPIRLLADCKLVRSEEPKGDLTYKVQQHNGLKIVTRPIYSDLCGWPTQQFVTRLFFRLVESDRAPVIGLVGGNEDRDELSFPVFSSFVLRN